MSSTYSAKSVANYFLGRAWDEAEDLSPMQIQKLVYFAHGWCLAIYERPLIREYVQAWEYGPVIPELYHEFKRFGSGSIQEYATNTDQEKVPPPTGNPPTKLLDKVWEVYGDLTANEMSALTHQTGTPWHKVFEQAKKEGRRGQIIDDGLIKEHFVAIGERNKNAHEART